jgi:multisubunit Na+/H+ antiporter MnhG subunit
VAVSVVVVLALGVTVATALVSVAGVLTSRDAFDGLHYIGPVAHVGAVALLVAVVADRGLDHVSLRVALVVLVLQLAAPAATHATARAGLVRGDAARLRGCELEVHEP